MDLSLLVAAVAAVLVVVIGLVVLALVARDAWIRALLDRRDARSTLDLAARTSIADQGQRLEAAEKKLRELEGALGRGMTRR